MATLTRDGLTDGLRSSLERLFHDDPSVVITSDGDDRTLVIVPGGQHFAITVQPITFSVPGTPRRRAS